MIDSMEVLVKEDVEKFINFAEISLKKLLGDLWNTNKDDAKEWVEIVAMLKWKIATEGLSDSMRITKKYIDLGLDCYILNLKGHVKDNTLNVVKTIFTTFFTVAISIGITLLKQKTDELNLDDKLKNIFG